MTQTLDIEEIKQKTAQEVVLKATHLYKTFAGPDPLTILRGVSLEVKAGETVAIMGKSGEGKSTLLHILGTLDSATKGSLFICGESIAKKDVSKVRNQKIGFIFQSYHLLEDFTTLENVLMPLKIARKGDDPSRGKELLKEVGLHKKEDVLAKYLSGGEKQRVAIARALCNHPAIILADEPTGNLDQGHSDEIQTLLLQSAKKWGAALILVTHDEEFARRCDRVLLLKEGHLYTLEE